MRTTCGAAPGCSGSASPSPTTAAPNARRKPVSACVAGQPLDGVLDGRVVADQRAGEHARALHRGERQRADRQVAGGVLDLGVAALGEQGLDEADARGAVLLAPLQGAAEQALGDLGVAALVEGGAEEEPPRQLVDAVALQAGEHGLRVGVGLREQRRRQVEAGGQVVGVLLERALQVAPWRRRGRRPRRGRPARRARGTSRGRRCRRSAPGRRPARGSARRARAPRRGGRRRGPRAPARRSGR